MAKAGDTDPLHVEIPHVPADDAFVSQLAGLAAAETARTRTARRVRRAGPLRVTFAAASVAAVVTGGALVTGQLVSSDSSTPPRTPPTVSPRPSSTAGDLRLSDESVAGHDDSGGARRTTRAAQDRAPAPRTGHSGADAPTDPSRAPVEPGTASSGSGVAPPDATRSAAPDTSDAPVPAHAGLAPDPGSVPAPAPPGGDERRQPSPAPGDGDRGDAPDPGDGTGDAPDPGEVTGDVPDPGDQGQDDPGDWGGDGDQGDWTDPSGPVDADHGDHRDGPCDGPDATAGTVDGPVSEARHAG